MTATIPVGHVFALLLVFGVPLLVYVVHSAYWQGFHKGARGAWEMILTDREALDALKALQELDRKRNG